jgi:hypothetical protein
MVERRNMAINILDWNKQQGYAQPRSYPQNFIGPVRPGDTVGGKSAYNAGYVGLQQPQVKVNDPNKGVLGSNSGGGMPSNPTTPINNQSVDLMQQAQDNANSQIDSDYESAMSMLGQAEGGLQAQAGTATSQINADITAGKTELGQAQAGQEQSTQAVLSTGEKNYTTNMQQARDLFRQTQQQNNAQLSALGISSSSVAEALAERLGVETARRIAGATGTVQEIRQNATVELGRIKKYYTDKSLQLEEQGRIQRESIQNSLIQGLNQINQQKGQAATAKSQARANLLQQVQQQAYALTQQQQQFNQQLQLWASQKSAALTPLTQVDFNSLMEAQLAEQNKAWNPSEFVTTPQVNIDKYGQMTGQITTRKMEDEKELF